MIWHDLITPAVRDLAWACFSGPLLSSRALDPELDNCQWQLTEPRQQMLLQLDREPQALLTSLQEGQSTRLGLYFERLWRFFIETDPDLELLAHNLPVRNGGHTLGEFDMLYRDIRSGRHFHLELAVKFYLGRADTNIWLGPGKQDQLSLKVAHLLERQTRLAEQAAAAPLLAQLGIDKVSRQMEVKGYLFSPWQGTTVLPEGYHPALNLYRWLDLEAFSQLPLAAGQDWQPLQRRQWLAPYSRPAEESSLDNEALAGWLHTHVTQRNTPQLLARCDVTGVELERYFVTPPDW